MNKRIFATISLAIALISSLPAQAAQEFPGKGDKKDWIKACQVYDKALSMRKRGQVDEAIKLYEQAIKLYPYDGDFYYNIAIHYARDKKDFAKSEDLINKAVELKPQVYSVLWERAVIAIDQNKLEDARGYIVEANKLKKTDEQQTELDSVLKQVDERR